MILVRNRFAWPFVQIHRYAFLSDRNLGDRNWNNWFPKPSYDSVSFRFHRWLQIPWPQILVLSLSIIILQILFYSYYCTVYVSNHFRLRKSHEKWDHQFLFHSDRFFLLLMFFFTFLYILLSEIGEVMSALCFLWLAPERTYISTRHLRLQMDGNVTLCHPLASC